MAGGDSILLRLRTAGARKTKGEIEDVAGATLEVREAQMRAQRAADQLNDRMDKQERAAKEVTDAIERFGRESRQAVSAQRRLERAQRDSSQAALRLERAQKGVSDELGKQEQPADEAGNALAGLGKKAGALAAAYIGVDQALSAFNRTLDRGYQEDITAGALGLSPRAQEKAGRVAADAFGAGYGSEIGQVYEAVVSVGQDIGGVETMQPGVLGRLIRRSLNLSTVFGAEVNEINRVVGDQLRNGMVRSSEEAFDLITVGFQRGANRSDELLDTLREYAEPVQSLGLDMRDFMSILVAGAKEGVYSSDRLGDALKELSIRAVDNVDTTKNAYRALGLDADATARAFAGGGPAAKRALGDVIGALSRVDGEVRRNRIGVNLFGSMWEDVGWRAIKTLDPTRDALGKVDGAARRLDGTISDGPKQTMDRFFHDMENDAVEVIGGIVIPLIEGDFRTAIEGIETSFGGVFENVANSGIWAVNQLIDAFNALPDGFNTPFGRVEMFKDMDRLSYVGAAGERLMREADARGPQGSYLSGNPADTLRDLRNRRHRRQAQTGAGNPLGAVPGGPIASGSRAGGRRTLNVTVVSRLDGRDVAKNTLQHTEDLAAFGLD